MIMDQICMRVPKFGVLRNGNFGGGTHDIYSRSSDSGVVAIWPCQQSRVMVGDDATNTPSEVDIEHLRRDCKDVAAVVAAKLREKAGETYPEAISAYYSMPTRWRKRITDPVDTRGALEMAIAVFADASLDMPVPASFARVGVTNGLPLCFAATIDVQASDDCLGSKR